MEKDDEKNLTPDVDHNPDGEVNIVDKTKVIDIKVKEELEKSFIAYAMAVNVSRAIPDVRDGLKPVHRRILYAMGELNLFNDKPYKKCARIVGDVIGKYHPHGDTAVYDALVRLAQDFTINAPLVDGHGNFGSVDGDPQAAMRYTEARLSKVASEMLRDIDKNTVDFIPNFDESEVQPSVLPARFPNLLVNGSDGIAVGMATNIPPHNLCEVIDGCVALIDNPQMDIEDLIKIIPAPDFPTRGIIMGRSGIRQAYRTGKGSFIIRSKCEIEEFNNGTRNRIVVTEIPYQVNKAKLIMQIADLVKNKRIEGISDIKEESDRQGLRIVIDLKRDANPQVVLNLLYKHSQLQVSFGVINLALVNNTPKICNLKEILENYLAFQEEVIRRRTEYDLDKAQAKAHILEGLVIAQAHIDEVIKTIKESADKNIAQSKLMEQYVLTEKQAIAILEMRLQRLTGLEVEKLKQDLEELHKLITELQSILENRDKLMGIIKQDLLVIKNKYGEPRKSEISTSLDGEIDIEDLIEEEDVVISLTHSGYIKRMPVTEYRSQHRGGKGIMAHTTKEEDFVENIYTTSTHDDLLCFSNFGRVYRIKCYEVPEAPRTSKGRAIINLLQLSPEERITTTIPLKKDSSGYLIMATRNGLIKKTSLEEFESIRVNGKIAIKLLEGDELISVYLTSGNDEIIIASSTGKCIRFSETNVRIMGRDTQGVKSIKLDKGECVVDMSVIKPDAYMLTVSVNGYGKRSNQEDYRVQGRAGKGIKAGVFNEVTGGLVNLKQVTDEDDIMLISDDGTIIRIKSTEISLIGRNTKGVRIMKVKNDAKIVCVAVTPTIEEDDVEYDEDGNPIVREVEVDEDGNPVVTEEDIDIIEGSKEEDIDSTSDNFISTETEPVDASLLNVESLDVTDDDEENDDEDDLI